MNELQVAFRRCRRARSQQARIDAAVVLADLWHDTSCTLPPRPGAVDEGMATARDIDPCSFIAALVRARLGRVWH